VATPQDSGSSLIANLEELNPTDCWGLLATASVGRLGLLVDGRPEVLPVNYALDGETVLFRTAEGTVLNQSALNIVAFEVDHVDEATYTGWSVMVQGEATDIGDAIDPTSERPYSRPLRQLGTLGAVGSRERV
jgi:nitroimidazol reductase NimA-like FMN-containing flavoprotein (pyridoxamine 5'-phosphate oxidase superfamily)